MADKKTKTKAEKAKEKKAKEKKKSIAEKAKDRKTRLEIGFPLKGRGTRITQPPTRGGAGSALFDKIHGKKEKKKDK